MSFETLNQQPEKEKSLSESINGVHVSMEEFGDGYKLYVNVGNRSYDFDYSELHNQWVSNPKAIAEKIFKLAKAYIAERTSDEAILQRIKELKGKEELLSEIKSALKDHGGNGDLNEEVDQYVEWIFGDITGDIVGINSATVEEVLQHPQEQS